MCGIAGLAAPGGVAADEALLGRMLDTIVHRCPDDHGAFASGAIAIGMRRLSIIDLESGHQPIHNEDRTVWVVLNGEIYNYATLRSELETRGHTFYTRSDTEIIVHLYEEMGERFVDRLNGMFSIALYDIPRQRLLLCRDRIGEKQLYYSYKNGRFAFGSEIKCVLASGVPSREMNLRALDSYFAFMYSPAPETAFQDIAELPPAHTLVLEKGALSIKRYWSLSMTVDRSRTEADWVDAFRAQMRASVASRLVSDVPVGALLSGGIDSSAIVAFMAEHAGQKVRTFCIGYGDEGQYYDERRYAKLVADQFGTEHEEFVVRPDILAAIPLLVDAFDQPFADSSAIANYYVFRETRKHVKVVLSGLGGDEVAAGYERYIGLKLHRLYQAVPAPLRSHIIRPLVEALPEPRSGGRWIDRIKRFVRQGNATEFEAYLGYMSAFGAAGRQDLWTPAARERIGTFDAGAVLRPYFEDRGIDDTLNRALAADVGTYLSGDLLTLTDRMSMLSSVEARAPFVDHELVEFMGRVPPELKAKGLTKKYLLKKALQGILPDEILHRRKQGFTVPLTVWFRNELSPLIGATLSRERVEKIGLFNWPTVDRLIREHTSMTQNHHNRIWALLMFTIWHERYIGH
jgi:asparagine synthase (glutamine-hydrolysing)